MPFLGGCTSGVKMLQVSKPHGKTCPEVDSANGSTKRETMMLITSSSQWHCHSKAKSCTVWPCFRGYILEDHPRLYGNNLFDHILVKHIASHVKQVFFFFFNLSILEILQGIFFFICSIPCSPCCMSGWDAFLLAFFSPLSSASLIIHTHKKRMIHLCLW